MLFTQLRLPRAALISCFLAFPALAENPAEQPAVMFSNFMGCKDGERVPRRTSGATETSSGTSSGDGYDWGTPEPASDGGATRPCYARAEGLWRPDTEVSLRKDIDISQWSGDPNLSSLAHGKYTQPELIILVPEPDGMAISVYDAANTRRISRYIQQDNTPLAAALGNRSAAKLYAAQGEAPHGATLEISTTHSGRSELRLGQKTYLRPAAQQRFGHCLHGSKATGDSIAAAFLTIENLRSTLRGYDVVYQNPFFFLDNDKSAIFQLSDRKCLVEKLEVPEGWTLIVEGTQGSMMHRSVVTSETEYQKTTASNFGFSAEHSAGDEEEGTAVGIGYGYQQSKNELEAMREAETVGTVVAYSRQKTMALVFNEGEVALSERFIDKVYRIKSQGPDDTRALDELIRTFGTHYAYAVTFGANAKLTRSISSRTYLEALRKDENFRYSGGVQILGLGLSGTYSEMNGKSSSTSETYATEDATFIAVNGNGSWNENGYSAGSSPAPILLDVRGLETLLTPVYFPDDPEIYTSIKQRVARHIDRYLRRHQALMTRNSLAPLRPHLSSPYYDAYEGPVSNKLDKAMNLHRRGESARIYVCHASDTEARGWYIRDRDWRMPGVYNGEMIDKLKPFRLKRKVTGGKSSWNEFVPDGQGEITRIVIRETGDLDVWFGKQKFKNGWARNYTPEDRLKVQNHLNKFDRPCWDTEELTEILNELEKEEN